MKGFSVLATIHAPCMAAARRKLSEASGEDVLGSQGRRPASWVNMRLC